jgi:homospermidine synthase
MVKCTIIGYGAVGRVMCNAIQLYTNIKDITVIDKIDYADIMPDEVEFINEELTKANYEKILNSTRLKENDFLIDLSTNVCTSCLIRYSAKHKIHFLVTSYEPWKNKSKIKITIADDMGFVQKNVMKEVGKCKTIFLGCGENPGKVCLDVRIALDKLDSSDKSYAEKCRDLKIRHIVISEYDSQKEFKPEKDKYRNTWSPTGWREENHTYAEFAIGSHEKSKPEGSKIQTVGDKKIKLCIMKENGEDTKINSYCIKKGKQKCFLIQHSEIFTIGEMCKIDDYQPTVYYAYNPSEATKESMKLLKGDLKNQKILNATNSKGNDYVGVLLLSEDFSYWCGSCMSTKEAQKLYTIDEVGPTTSQVVGMLLMGIEYCLMKPNEGVIYPEKIDKASMYKLYEKYKKFYGTEFCDYVEFKPTSLQITDLII